MLKRCLFAVLNLTLLLALSGCFKSTPVPLVPPDELPGIITETFADDVVGETPDNWRIVNRGDGVDTPVVADDPARSAQRSLRFFRGPDNSHLANGVVLDFKPLSRQAVVSFWFYATDPGRTLVLTLSSDAHAASPFGASTGPFLVLRDSTVQAYSEDKFQDAGTFTINKWHKVTIEVDVTTKTYNVLLDDAEQPAHPNAFQFRNNATANIAALGIAYQAASQTGSYDPVFVDDIEVRGQ